MLVAATVVLFTLAGFGNCETDEEFAEKYKLGKERVCLYHEWEMPVESIEDKSSLFSLIPERYEGVGAENNILLALFEDRCEKDVYSNAVLVGAHYQSGPVMHIAAANKRVFPAIVDNWQLSDDCVQLLFIPKGSFWDQNRQFHKASDTSLEGTARFLNDVRQVSTSFHNAWHNPVTLSWFENVGHEMGTLEAGNSSPQNTFLGHIFIAEDSASGYLVDYWVIEDNSPVQITFDRSVCMSMGLEPMTAECDKAMREELQKWSFAFWARKREALNYAQRKVVRPLTATGFKKTRLPEEIYARIRAFWERTNNDKDLIKEHSSGPILNQFTSDTFMTYLPDAERQLLIGWYKDQLEKWSSFEGLLELTSLYGIRKYTRGAILQMHQDTCATHVVSAILNVDSKLDSGKDWPLQIYDHSDVLHEVTMKPGDVVFYESAKAGHSRFKPLPGDYYSNIFTHFKPKGKWNYDWF